jgi:hypothetical protein
LRAGIIFVALMAVEEVRVDAWRFRGAYIGGFGVAACFRQREHDGQ